MPSRTATIYDVAALAGVGRTTVSRVMNGDDRVSETTRLRVMQAIATLRYRANPQARLLAGGRIHDVMFVHPCHDEVGPGSWYNLQIESGAQRACAKAGLQLRTMYLSPASEKRHQRILEPVLSQACDGLILAPPFSDDAGLLERLRAHNIAVVCIAAGPETQAMAAGIGIDDEAAGYDLTRHLLGLGHRCFAFIHGLETHISAGLRYRGFGRALEEAGLDTADMATFRGDLSFQAGYDQMRCILDRSLNATAVICANDDMAAGAMYCAHQAGVRVPADLTIVGFDDAPFAALIWPPLTTVAQPVFTMAQRAVEIMVRKIEGRNTPYEFASHRLVVRDSAAGPREAA